MRLGICIKGFFKGDLFDVDLLGRRCWTHSSVEHEWLNGRLNWLIKYLNYNIVS